MEVNEKVLSAADKKRKAIFHDFLSAFRASFLVNLYFEEPTRIVHQLGNCRYIILALCNSNHRSLTV